MLRLILVCAAGAFFCFSSGCSEDSPETADDSNAVEEAAVVQYPAVKRLEYANDQERLTKLAEKVNRACGRAYTAAFGGGRTPTINSSLLEIDYALFDSLSDDGAAVLIAEAIASRLWPPPQPYMQVSQAQKLMDTGILKADEFTGNCIAKAGFSPDAFNEWLGVAKRLSPGSLRQDGMPDQMRLDAFMRGYLARQ